MILGIGIDAVAVARFAHWHQHSHTQLSRLFSADEITYCLATSAKSAERFAARFAAREALFKALSSALPNHRIPFLTLCRAVTIASKKGVPTCLIHWDMLAPRSERCTNKPLHTHLSLTHTAKDAIAFVILTASAETPTPSRGNLI